MPTQLLTAKNLYKEYRSGKEVCVAVNNMNLDILKSIGYPDWRINREYILQYLMTAFLSGGVGVLVCGILFQTWLGEMFGNIDRKLYHIKGLWLCQFLALLIIIAILYITIRISIYGIVKISPLDATYHRKEAGDRSRVDLPIPTERLLTLYLALLKCIRRKLETVFIFVLTLGTALLYLTFFYILDGVKRADTHLEEWGIVEMDIYISRKTNADEIRVWIACSAFTGYGSRFLLCRTF